MPDLLVKARLNVASGSSGTRRISVPTVESYSVDSAMDTDTDSYRIEIGDPHADLVSLLRRDTEVRCNIFGGHRGNLLELQTGFADTIGYTEEGTLSIQGRDITSLAVDSDHPPQDFAHIRPHKLIKKEAQKLGFSSFALQQVKPSPKEYTDGSESYWEFWYRMARKRKMWIWAEGNGTLKMDTLNYGDKSVYKFGTPRSLGSPNWIPVSTCEVTKSTQGRVGEVWVIGERKDVSLIAKVKDKSISEWVKRPLRIIQDTDVKTRKEARERAYEEIFEGKVGSLEIEITVAHPGFIVRQNNVGWVRIPQMDIDKEFFVVGNNIIGGPEGFVQKIRLREKQFALTRRIPDDPKLAESHAGNPPLGTNIGLPRHQDWGEFFVTGAREYRGPWPFDLFCATLLAICHHESSFKNVRYPAGGPEWYPKPTGAPAGNAPSQNPGAAGSVAAQVERWKRAFANERANPLSPRHPSSNSAVGPMQLVSDSYVDKADAIGGKRGEYDGGRWKPEANIRAGAYALHTKLQGLTVSEANMYYACGFRYFGSSSTSANQAYANEIKRLVRNVYLPKIQEAQQEAAQSGASWEGGQLPKIVNKMMIFLRNQLGKPYVWGASGPNSYDCSGLAYAAYRSVGLGDDIGGRTSVEGYWASGKGRGKLFRVTKDDLRPGDMVCLNGLAHMGVAIGDGQMIVAPHTGDVVKRQAISQHRWVGALRCQGVWPGNQGGTSEGAHWSTTPGSMGGPQ